MNGIVTAVQSAANFETTSPLSRVLLEQVGPGPTITLSYNQSDTALELARVVSSESQYFGNLVTHVANPGNPLNLLSLPPLGEVNNQYLTLRDGTRIDDEWQIAQKTRYVLAFLPRAF